MRFLIVDDHAVLRNGMVALLAQAGDGAQVLEASDAEQGLGLAAAHPDLDAVFLDLEMPGMNGMSAIAEFGRRHPDLPIIVLSSSEDPRDVRRALTAGALGYVPKSVNAKTLLAALHLVLEGGVYVPPLMLNDSGPGAARTTAVGAPFSGERLTDRQVDVLRRIERGLSNKEIGLELGLSEKTVKVHVTGIFKALGVVNRAQAASAARKIGMA